MKVVLLLLPVLVGCLSAQKLLFKSNKELEEARLKLKNQQAVVKGFGFKEPRQYFTAPRISQNVDIKVSEGAVECPDKKSACPDGSTCCAISLQAFGCCPMLNATCCLDRQHCCPMGAKCDVVKKVCYRGEMVTPWFEKLPAIMVDIQDTPVDTPPVVSPSTESDLGSVICPDGEHECQDGQTCCKTGNGYACCPIPNASCCSDGIHCCPKDYKCDVAHSRCIKSSSTSVTALFRKIPAINRQTGISKAEGVRCDGKHECPTGNTCCKVDDVFECCPKPNAVCCSDGQHCCPSGTICDVSSGKCNQGLTQVDWLEKQPALTVDREQCDASHFCPSGNTCCKLASGQWGCCPIPNAVCCSDGAHCCPSGSTCDVSSGKCNQGLTQVDWLEKQPALTVDREQCDASHFCPSGNTCCKLASGQWGCCPIPNAVCCSDGAHCCPSGSTCDVSSGKCNQGLTQVDWLEKQPALTVDREQCDASHFCPSGNTCCKLASGQWGCCPIPNAVCCSDGAHCCPSGSTCDVSSGKCNQGLTQVDWLEKQPALTVDREQCDASHFCPSGNTCCKLASGQWGCCPIPNAVCCSDGAHCCPSGSTCDVSSGKCNQGLTQVDWLEKQPALTVDREQCDASHFCPSGNTCCKLASGQWGCCPIPNAVCCSDGAHCCPSGSTCDVSSGKCNQGLTQVDWLEKQPALTVDREQCDASHFCPSGNTCCKLASGQWGCCPIPNAVCCSDGAHCCPSGSTCDVSSGKCNQGLTQVDWLEKQPALTVDREQCDASHFCPSGNTCCKLASGQWGCCPIPNAVCCSDGAHCCPSGSTCDVSSGKCNQGLTQVDWLEKQPALTVDREQCDASHFCPSGNTCCKLASGQWGCCPIPNAVCCSDGAHCCPSGSTCDVSSGKCNQGLTQVDWLEKQPVLTVDREQCDASHFCPSGNTCCKLASGQWGCCPIPNAVCCSDGAHCCPSGSTCDVSSGKCNQGLTQVDWLEKQPALTVDREQCDASHFCPSGNTCCKLASGQWGCCPIPNAVCCSDGAHCCPSGSTCDVSSGKCNQGLTQVDWLEKQPALTVDREQCDASHFCPSGNTCCKLASGQWGCCPIPNAVCCSDGAHCCPSGYTCDVSSGKCNRGLTQVDWLEKQPALTVDREQCDASHFCPSGNTCCKLASGQWGCCPIPNAVCCSDGAHCCPSGSTCDVSSGKCNQGLTQVDWLEKQPALTVDREQCDASHFCPSGNTCCKLASGQWGCCPIPNAVCCSDGAHCCPSGSTCDVSSGKCNQGLTQVDWLEKQPALTVDREQCDASHFCPSGNTCCKLASGQWGCCPIPNAVCCSDGAHCCPSGSTCDVSSGKCNQGLTQVDWLEKQPALTVDREQCDASHFCPSGNTCCKLASGQWGCCPIPNAVCCSDGAHCCPSGSTCDVSSGKCNQGLTQVDWLEKQPALTVDREQCDASHFCPSGNTCCKLASGQWGCCPIPNAVCCSDGAHCCPSGSTCDVSSGKCNQGLTQVDWLEKQPALTVDREQCDASHFCPSGNTCCKLASGQWGCCPIPNAVCCSDGKHCCPSGTTCDVSSGKCNPGLAQIDWLEKQPVSTVGSVKCDSSHFCPSGNTCCKLASGQWGCCPIPNAVCCSDGKHCCPSGTTCDVSSGKCNPGLAQIDWLEKQPVSTVGSVKCDSSHFCPSGNTCCKLASGQWGCCPIPNAVCCSDGAHCCPSGSTCDVSSGKCNQGLTQVDWLEKQPALTVDREQCDASHFCPSGNTCCKLASGQWGCCPIPNAVCCSDGKHCCPSGSTCDVSSGKCNQGLTQVDWLEKQPALTVDREQCDASHFCPSGNTCCKLASGQWGCCPIPNAVCCSDGKHCCPSGTTCDVSSGKCNPGLAQIDWLEKQPVSTVGSVKCDSTHFCPSGNTCCKLASGQWGCCPRPDAVCCSDHVHCCPHGYTCDSGEGKCSPGTKQLQLDWSTTQPAIAPAAVDWFRSNPGEITSPVVCDDTMECPEGNTCCKLASGEWGCCPLPNAECCSDMIHCCPGGWTCDASSGECKQGTNRLPWMEKMAALKRAENSLRLMVICPDGSECRDQETCCQMDHLTSTYGCCPLPNAVCCSDNQHCCPAGYRCNLKSSSCVRGKFRSPLIQTVRKQKPIETVKLVKIVEPVQEAPVSPGGTEVQCPGGVTCPENAMCCDNGKGGSFCCEYPKGVCCKDKEHCCPPGYICDQGPNVCRIPETTHGASTFLRNLITKQHRP